MNKILSIILPVYGVEKYIKRCLDSILYQLNDLTELIIVNDCTKDRSIEICKKMTKNIKNVKILERKKNGGLSLARNTGIEFASGEYLWFIDSDDYIEPTAILHILKVIENNPSDLYMFNHIRENSNGENIAYPLLCRNEEFIIQNDENRMQFICKYIAHKFGFEVWSKIFSKKILENNNIQFEPNKEVFAEDICFILYYILHCKKIVTSDKSLYIYCIRDNSIMGSNSSARLHEMEELAYRTYLFSKSTYIKMNFSMIYGGIAIIHENLATENEIVNYCKNIIHVDFIKEMCSKTRLKDIKSRISIYGKKSSILQWLFAKRLLAALTEKKGICWICSTCIKIFQ